MGACVCGGWDLDHFLPHPTPGSCPPFSVMLLYHLTTRIHARICVPGVWVARLLFHHLLLARMHPHRTPTPPAPPGPTPPPHTGAFRVVADKYVTDDSGTGVVHQAPGHGEDDWRVCSHNSIITKVRRWREAKTGDVGGLVRCAAGGAMH